MKRFALMTLVAALAIPMMSYAAGKEAFFDTDWNNDNSIKFTGKLDGGKSSDLWTAEFATKLRDASGNLLNGGEVLTGFCVDPWQGAKEGKGFNTAVDFIKPSDYVVRNENAGLQAAWLFDTYYKETSTKQEIAGLQLAIWEIIADSNSSIDLTKGNFIVSAGNATAIANAKSYLNSLPQSFSSTMVARLNSSYVIGHTGTYQDLIVKIGDPVPEPATMLLLGLGLLGIVGIARKKRNR